MILTEDIINNLPLSQLPDDYDNVEEITAEIINEFNEAADKIDVEHENKSNNSTALPNKMGKSENITNKALSLAIHDNFPNLKLEFVEHNDKTNRSYPVDLKFKEVKYHDDDRIVLLGNLTVSLKEFGLGTIEYQFNTQTFYRVSYSDKTNRSRKIHTLVVDNTEIVNNLLSFVSNYMYSKEDYESNINNNGSTTSKPH